MDRPYGTVCYQKQEQPVTNRLRLVFQADDKPRAGMNPTLMAVSDPKGIPTIAFRRLSELIQDMGWAEDTAIDEFNQEIAVPLGYSDKTVDMWFRRRTIPVDHIFNLSTVLGVDAGWLAGQTHMSKDAAIRSGLYRREVDRENRRGKRRA